MTVEIGGSVAPVRVAPSPETLRTHLPGWQGCGALLELPEWPTGGVCGEPGMICVGCVVSRGLPERVRELFAIGGASFLGDAIADMLTRPSAGAVEEANYALLLERAFGLLKEAAESRPSSSPGEGG